MLTEDALRRPAVAVDAGATLRQAAEQYELLAERRERGPAKKAAKRATKKR